MRAVLWAVLVTLTSGCKASPAVGPDEPASTPDAAVRPDPAATSPGAPTSAAAPPVSAAPADAPAASEASPAKDTSPPPDAAPDVQSAASTSATKGPVLLAEGEVPWSLAVDATHVYFTDVHFEGTKREARVARVPKAGGPVERVSGQSDAALTYFGIDVVGADVFWAGYRVNGAAGAIFRAPVTGGAPTRFNERHATPLSLVASGAELFWINLSPPAVVRQGAQAARDQVLATTVHQSASCIAVTGDTVVFLSLHQRSRVLRVPTSGGPTKTLVEGDEGGMIRCLTADARHVYFTRWGTTTQHREPTYRGDGSVHRVALSGGPTQPLAGQQMMPHAVVARGRFVYWHNDGDGTVVRAPRDGGRPKVVATTAHGSEAFRTNAMVADADGIYWLGGRKVWALRLP